MSARRLSLVGAALWALAASAAAQPGPAPAWNIEPGTGLAAGRWILEYNGGWAMREGPGQPSVEGSFAAQASAEYRLYELLTTGLEFGYSFGHKLKGRTSGPYAFDLDGDGQNDLLAFDSDVKVKVLELAPFVRLGRAAVDPQEGGRLNPFFLVGAGYYRQTQSAGTGTFTGRTSSGVNLPGASRPIAARETNHFGASFGAGISVTLTQSLSFGVEGRYHTLFDGGEDTHYIIPTGHLRFWF